MKITLSLCDLGIDVSPPQSLRKTIELNCQTVVQVISRKFLNSRQKLKYTHVQYTHGIAQVYYRITSNLTDTRKIIILANVRYN